MAPIATRSRSTSCRRATRSPRCAGRPSTGSSAKRLRAGTESDFSRSFPTETIAFSAFTRCPPLICRPHERYVAFDRPAAQSALVEVVDRRTLSGPSDRVSKMATTRNRSVPCPKSRVLLTHHKGRYAAQRRRHHSGAGVGQRQNRPFVTHAIGSSATLSGRGLIEQHYGDARMSHAELDALIEDARDPSTRNPPGRRSKRHLGKPKYS